MNTRGQSAEGKGGPPLWYWGSLPSLPFSNGIHAQARFRTLFAGVIIVYGECGKLDDNVVMPTV